MEKYLLRFIINYYIVSKEKFLVKEGEFLIKILVLSRFDVKVGPKLFLNVPELESPIFLDHVPLLMDFYEKGFFIHEFGELKSSNLIFTIPSSQSQAGARGDIETLMISIIIKDEEDGDPKVFQGLLEQIIHDLGYEIEVIQVGVSERKLFGLLEIIKRLSSNAPWSKIMSAFRFGLAKLSALDKIERVVQKVRPVERIKGTANRLFTKAINAIDRADDYDTLKKVHVDFISQLNLIDKDTQYKTLIVGITGEFYVVLEL